MTITITVPSDTKSPGNAGHTSDHNVIVDALNALAAAAFNTAGDNVSGLSTFSGGIQLGAASPGTPTSGITALYSANGSPTAKLDSSFAGAMALGQAADRTSHTVTAATATALSSAWTIPNNDANTGTVYRLTFAGFGTWGSTQQNLNVIIAVNGSNVMAGGGLGQVAAAEFAISTNIWFRGVAEVVIVSTGAGGTASYTIEYTVNARATNLTGTAAQNSITVVNMNSVTGGTTAIDTTASNSLQIQASWGSTTGAPTITCVQSFLERICA